MMTPTQEARAELRLVKPDWRFSGQKLAEALDALDARLKRLEAAAAATPLSADTDASGEADRQAEPPPIRTAAPPALRGRKLKRD